jgi:hypothetical protein
MGYSARTLKEILFLSEIGVLPEGFSIMDIGSQNIYVTSGSYLKMFIEHFAPDADLAMIDLDGLGATGKMASLLALCGAPYAAIDIFQDEGVLLFDLDTDQVPEDHKMKYDYVSNMGTTEHVLNQKNCFQVIHDFTKVGGVMHHDVPAGGYFYHGFFNYTPLFFHYIAAANDYEILKSEYSKAPDASPYGNLAGEGMRKMGWPDDGFHDVGMQFILRKTVDAPFRTPMEVSTSLSVDHEFMKSKGHGKNILERREVFARR